MNLDAVWPRLDYFFAEREEIAYELIYSGSRRKCHCLFLQLTFFSPLFYFR